MAAMRFPDLETSFSDGRKLMLPIRSSEGENDAHKSINQNASATLLCLSFRASSQVCNSCFHSRIPLVSSIMFSSGEFIYFILIVY